MYELYAWGLPIIITLIGVFFDNFPNSEKFIRPRFGEGKCWFYGKYLVSCIKNQLKFISFILTQS
jgi:hypothetical protein